MDIFAIDYTVVSRIVSSGDMYLKSYGPQRFLVNLYGLLLVE